MAGGNSFTKNPQKGKYNPAFNSAEVYKSQDNSTVTVSSILNGVLRPGETIDFSQEIKTPEKPRIENYLQKEQSLFINQHQNEIEKTIQDLRLEIKNLVQVTENLDHEVEQSTSQNITETNKYQLSFLERIKNLIIQFRKNINEAGTWLESFNHKKSKQNAFWNKARSKNGGEKYLNSSEHAVARSAN
jgi:carboxylesterase type B